MKKKFTQIALAMTMAMGLALSAHASDWIVEENGVAPNFATIQSAVTAAVSGDRIFVKNKAGNVPYNENVTINKSLSILAYDPDGTYYVFGTYTVNAIAGGGEVTFIGMTNNSGSIVAGSTGTLAAPTRINVLGCNFLVGSYSGNLLGFVSHIAGNNFYSGSISTRTATITGNFVNGSINVADIGGTVTGYTEDTLYVCGNRLMGSLGGGLGGGGINWSNTSDYCWIANNWVSYNGNGIVVSGAKTAAGGANVIENNSVESSTAYNNAISFSATIAAGATVRIMNNSLNDISTGECCTGNPEYAVQFGTVATGAFVNVDYNVYKNYINGLSTASAALVSFTGNTVGGASFDNADPTGICTAPECINLGSPSTDYTDLDLTRNDVGVSGGSYNGTNFWPNQTGGARVYLVKTPRTVVQSSTINAKGDSFDR
jgi:hypothetical protein